MEQILKRFRRRFLHRREGKMAYWRWPLSIYRVRKAWLWLERL